MTTDDRQRIDKWLWFTRVVKTRPLAQDLAASGHVRINGRRIDSAAQAVRVGDVLTIGLRGRVLVYRVLGFAERRVAYPEARLLYEDLAPPPPGEAPAPDLDDDGEAADDAAPGSSTGLPHPVPAGGHAP